MTLIEGSIRVESKTSQTIIINLKFLVCKFLFEIKMFKIFFLQILNVKSMIAVRLVLLSTRVEPSISVILRVN